MKWDDGDCLNMLFRHESGYLLELEYLNGGECSKVILLSTGISNSIIVPDLVFFFVLHLDSLNMEMKTNH